ncbi:MAG: aldehyde dehydrogenase family protein, partial [Alphaproteobacteria bacterium]|nr:aldehyde dehydrogenase family protein [Alphaproteobacteria bacterium]
MSTLDENLAKAQTYLDGYRESGVENLIDGQSLPASSGDTFETISPVDLKPLASVAQGTAADIDRAAKAATKAFPAWAAMPGKERKAILHRIADAIVERAEEIAFLESLDTGQSIRFMAKAALRGAENFRFFADQAPGARDGKTLHGPNQMNFTTRKPIG